MSKPCGVLGCDEAVSKPGHHLCYRHWKLQRAGRLEQVGDSETWREVSAPATNRSDGESGKPPVAGLSSTKLGKHFGLPATRINLLLAELGWIEKYTKGWTPTDRGNHLGAQVREARQSGVPYVVWPESILTSKILTAAVAEQLGDSGSGGSESEASGSGSGTAAAAAPANDGFRDRFPAKFRATDGHLVRSRAEMLIDNWLYMQGIVHAVERKLPIEEDVYCDFYLPMGKVYIEFWGLESDPAYVARKDAKVAIYGRYQLNLVELRDEDIMTLDDTLPRMLLRHGIDCT